MPMFSGTPASERKSSPFTAANLWSILKMPFEKSNGPGIAIPTPLSPSVFPTAFLNADAISSLLPEEFTGTGCRLGRLI